MDMNNKIIRRSLEWILRNSGGKFLSQNEYCATRDVFEARLDTLLEELNKINISHELIPLIIAVCGEIGNNSFDHNSGSWRDIPGIFFSSDIDNRIIVLADRGQGIKKTLEKAVPNIKTAKDALRIAFTKIISGRLPEHRGNGLKFVTEVVKTNNLDFFFKSGNATVKIKRTLSFHSAKEAIKGCLAVIGF